MSFIFRRNNSKKTETETETEIEVEASSLTTELKTLKKQFRDSRRQEIVDKFVERVKVLFEQIIKTESQKGNYVVERKDLTITTRDYELLTDSDKIQISDRIKKAFTGYFVSVAIRNNSVDIIMKWDFAGDTFWEDSTVYESKTVADNYNKLPRLNDNLSDATSVEPPEEIVEDILDYLRQMTEKYGCVPRQYNYKFPHTASTHIENSNYRRTMDDVIKLLPSDFQSIKGSFQRTSKNAIVSFTLEFVTGV